MFRRFSALCLPAVLAALLHRGLAAEASAAPDPDLPQAFDPSALTSLTKSPFNRVVSFEDTFMLTGIAFMEGKPMATLVNKQTKQRFLVCDEPNRDGWRLAEASNTSDVYEAAVKLFYGDEEVYLHYTDVLKMPEKRSSSSRHREVTPVDIHRLSESDYIRKDENGKPYVRGSIYLPTADRDRYYNDMSDAARDRFRDIVKNNRDNMMRYTPDQRAAYSKKAFDQALSEEKAGKLK